MENKDRHTLRLQVLASRDELTGGERQAKSLSITDKVVGWPPVVDARAIFVYMNFRSEVETTDMVRRFFSMRKVVTIPFTRTETHELVAVQVTDIQEQVAPGYCGIPEPLPNMVQTAAYDPSGIDVVIVPGSVFDKSGGRLGYGGGYYDRFLAKAAPGALRVGLAFELQVVDTVPVEPHDQFMDFVVTEENFYDCGGKRYA